METKTAAGNLEKLAAVIIDTIKEITSVHHRAITPESLQYALSRRKDFSELIRAATATTYRNLGPQVSSQAEPSGSKQRKMNGGDPRLSMNGVLLEETIQRLRDFRTALLNESLDKLSNETLQQASALLEVVRSSAHLDQILDVNPEILRILRLAFQKVGGDIEEFTRLFQEIGLNLVEMEAGILSSSNTVQETFRGSRDFNNTLEGDLMEIRESVQNTGGLNDFKGFLVRRLDGIKVAIEQKRKADEQQLKKANKEIQRLRQHVRQVKQELSRVSIEAESLEKEVLLDPLTGIHNRRAYEKRVREELNRFLSHGQVFSMLLIDIDHFKDVNDRYGHWTGDRCLEEFTKLVKSTLRGTDFLARYGGEEFVALLPGTDSEGISTASERIRQIIERARFMYRDQQIPITVSIGGTHVKPGDQSSETIFNRVDTAMYKAKQSGRNRVVLG